MSLNYLLNSPKIKRVINDEVSRINNSSFNLNIAILESDFENRNRTLFVILPTLSEASKYYDALSSDLNDKVLFYPADETNISSLSISSFEFKYERIIPLTQLQASFGSVPSFTVSSKKSDTFFSLTRIEESYSDNP